MNKLAHTTVEVTNTPEVKQPKRGLRTALRMGAAALGLALSLSACQMGKNDELAYSCENGAKITSEAALGTEAIKKICKAEAKMAPFLDGTPPKIKVVEDDNTREFDATRETVTLNRNDVETRRNASATTHELAHAVWYDLPEEARATVTAAYEAIPGVDKDLLQPPENTAWAALTESTYVGGYLGHPQDGSSELFASGTANLLNNSAKMAEEISGLPVEARADAQNAVEAVYCGLVSADPSAASLKPAARAFDLSPSQC